MLLPSSLLITISHKRISPSAIRLNLKSTGSLQSPPHPAFLPLITKIKHRILNVFTPLSPPLFFSSLSMDNEPCLVLEAWCTHKQSEWQVTEEAVPLVLIIPVKPLNCWQCTSISASYLPCWRRTALPFHQTSLSLDVLRAGEVWQWQRVECSLVINMRLAGEASSSNHVGFFI